ncbi:MAG: spoIIA [Chitinophagaceae bacterium]|nr:spoIIA [Chitinophagaceae bacterium]
MKYTLEKNDKYILFQLHEEKLTSLVAPDLKTELVKLNAEGTANIILDLGDVKYTDSSGLSSILVGNRVCQNDNGTFVLTRLSDHVTKLIQISQLDTILNITPTVEEAIDLVFMNSLENDLSKEGEEE